MFDFSSIKASDMKKRTSSTSHKSRIHPSFPDQGTVQPNHMGSQSNTPNLDMQLQGPQAPSLPVDSSTSMAAQGEY